VTKQCCASLFNGGTEVFRKLRTPGSLKLNIKVRGQDQKLEAEAKRSRGRGQRLRGRGQNFTSRPVWPQGFNISANDRSFAESKKTSKKNKH